MKQTKRILAALLAALLAVMCALPAFAEEGAPEKPFENSEFYTVGDVTLHYRVLPAAGEEKGRIFMIHGFALSGVCFELLAAELTAGGYTCVLADLPDFGWSSRETDQGELRPREELMYELMTHISGEPWYVAAHSMGGYIALALAEKYPESVKNLLLYGTSGNDGAGDARGALMRNKTFVSVMGPMMEAMGRCKPLVRLLYIAACQDVGFAMRYDVEKITAPYAIKGTGAGALLNFSLLPVTNYEAVRGMAPILFVNGSRDSVIPQADKEKLRGYLPEGSRDVVIEGGGHMAIETHAAEIGALTLDFMAENP